MKKTLITLCVGIALGAGAYFGGATMSEALSIAFGDDQVKIEACIDLIEGNGFQVDEAQ